jgi:hypothetical protein
MEKAKSRNVSTNAQVGLTGSVATSPDPVRGLWAVTCGSWTQVLAIAARHLPGFSELTRV